MVVAKRVIAPRIVEYREEVGPDLNDLQFGFSRGRSVLLHGCGLAEDAVARGMANFAEQRSTIRFFILERINQSIHQSYQIAYEIDVGVKLRLFPILAINISKEMRGAFYVLLSTYFGVCKSQYISINPKPTKLSQCDDLSSTAYTERFFDLIFTEFHNTPPACICIQMCPKQPTYCYPNGCLKRPERKMHETNCMSDSLLTTHIEGTTKSATFEVDHKDVAEDMLQEPALITSYGGMTERSKLTDLIYRSNPFKDLVLKYKKIPKLEMKYNLREQVRNTKTDKLNKEKNIDISKTRWPSNKHLLHGKSPLKRMQHYKMNDDTRQTKFFVSLFPESEPSNYSPVFYKKYLTKRDSINGVNVEALYLYQTDTGNFTLETLIENLIEGSLDKSKKDTNISLDEKVDYVVNQEYCPESNKNCTEISFLLDVDNDTNSILNNTAVSIVSMDYTKENIDVNKYYDDNNMNNRNMILEMITNMSKKIELQNKSSLELMERVIDTKHLMLNELNTSDINLQNNITATTIKVTESTVKLKNATELLTMDKIDKNMSHIDFNATKKSAPVTKTSIYRKTKPSIIRRLKRRKIN